MSDIIETLDKAAGDLLQRTNDVGNVSLAEAVKAFEAVAKWAQTRAQLVAEQPQEGEGKLKVVPFDELQRKYRHGAKARRRGAASPSAETDAPGDSVSAFDELAPASDYPGPSA